MRNHSDFVLLLAVTVVVILGSHAGAQVDTDGDGLLDLIDVPDFDPNATVWIDFKSPAIEDLDGASQLTGAWGLFLDRNNITTIDNGDFQGLTGLGNLSLTENSLSFVETGSFDDLASLVTLYLSQNSISAIDAGVFNGLINLANLSIANNDISTIENGVFQSLANLRELDLRRNSISAIEAGALDVLENLQVLQLEGNSISRVEGRFTRLKNLEWLFLSDNHINGIEGSGLEGLDNLEILEFDRNSISSIESGAFHGLEKLHSLSLGNNEIQDVGSVEFQHLVALQFLTLSGNRISIIENGVFDGLDDLQWLSLDTNHITQIEDRAFVGLSNLHSLNLSNNSLAELNLTEATFNNLGFCSGEIPGGFCVDSDEIASLVLDSTVLSLSSFDNVVSQTTMITDASVGGLRFSDEKPSDLTHLLGIDTLDNVTVDQGLFEAYADELNAFAAQEGTALTVIGFGDANLDGEFNSGDLVAVFQAGEYEDSNGDNSGWSEGDWNGDGDFTSGDLVFVFHDGGYEQGPRVAANAVPEPASFAMLMAGLIGVAIRRRYVVERERPPQTPSCRKPVGRPF